MEHIDNDKILAKANIPFEKSKEEIWAEVFENLPEQAPVKKEGKVLRMSGFKAAIAASVLFAIIGAAFCRFYTVSFNCPQGQHMSLQLPDESSVELNAASEISYQPYFWRFNRSVHLQGEAFFEVKKGSRFSVWSKQGKTSVLGTGFNIKARGNNYEVFCAHGKVQVSSNRSEESVILLPNEMALLTAKNEFVKKEASAVSEFVSWKDNAFKFKAIALPEVFREIEDQYQIDIQGDAETLATLKYSGYFKKTATADSVLHLICHTFDLTFVKQDDGKYLVLQKE